MTKLQKVTIVLSVIVLSVNFGRDLLLQKAMLGDLRNRIIGARMQWDGLSPYFYKWKEGDNIRYYEPRIISDESDVSAVTASPFFHLLLYPISGLSYDIVSNVWIGILYALLILSIVLSVGIGGAQKIIPLCLVGVGFTFTETWLDTVTTKQSYLFIPFFGLLVYYFLQKAQSRSFYYLLAGIFAACLILSKPNAVLCLAPLLFIQHRYSIKARMYFVLPIVVGLLLFPGWLQRTYWVDYSAAIKEHVDIHQQVMRSVTTNEPSIIATNQVRYKEIEGFNVDGEENFVTKRYTAYVEHANFFAIIQLLFSYNITPNAMTLLCGITMLILGLLFYRLQNREGHFSLEAVVIFGFCMYMISDIGSPIYRGHYNVVQWLFPLLVTVITYNKRYNWLYVLLLLGSILNLHYKPIIPMQHVVAEYLWLATLTIYSFIYRSSTKTSIHA